MNKLHTIIWVQSVMYLQINIYYIMSNPTEGIPIFM